MWHAIMARGERMDWKLELVVLPVADVDRAKAFYLEQAASTCCGSSEGRPSGWSSHPAGLGVLRCPHGNPGPPAGPGLHLVVDNVDAAHDDLASRGPDPTRSSHFERGTQVPARPRPPGLQSFLSFADPDGNAWAGPRKCGGLRPGRGERPG